MTGRLAWLDLARGFAVISMVLAHTSPWGGVLNASEYLTAPWTWKWMYRRWPGYKLQEYVCEDNRYDPGLDYQQLRVEPAH